MLHGLNCVNIVFERCCTVLCEIHGWIFWGWLVKFHRLKSGFVKFFLNFYVVFHAL